MNTNPTSDQASICECCQGIPRFFDYRTRPRWLSHQPSYAALIASAATCPVCRLIVTAFSRAKVTGDVDQDARVALESSYLKLGLQGFKASVSGRSSNTVICVPADEIPYRARGVLWANKGLDVLNERLAVVKEWLEDCTLNHGLECESFVDELPTRVLDIEAEAEAGRIKLIEGKDGTGLYAALSHCWGITPMPVTLTSASINTLKAGIPVQDLPRTFQDAVRIAECLGIRYLWIDSLCIIQHDRDDWEREAAKMAQVYQNAHITIAAVASSSWAGGCIRPHDPTEVVEFPRESTDPAPKHTKFLVRVEPSEALALLESPLYSRAWTLQELILAPRILLCCEGQFFWQCRSYVSSEDYSVWVDRRFSTLPMTSEYGADHIWWKWVENYSRRNLTKQADKLAALAGLTTFAASSSTRLEKDECLAGMWSQNIPRSLLWCTPAYGQRSTLPGGPTWSWVSVTGPIQMPGDCDMSIQVRAKPAAKVTEASVEWEGRPLTSPLRKVTLRLSARFQRARVGSPTTPKEWWRVSKVFSASGKETFDLYSVPKPQAPFGDGFIGTASFDIQPAKEGTELLCLQIGNTHPQYKSQGNDPGTVTASDHWFLMLESTGRSNQYRRVGIGMVPFETCNWGRGGHAQWVVSTRTFPPVDAKLRKMVNENLPNDGSWSGFLDGSPLMDVELV